MSPERLPPNVPEMVGPASCLPGLHPSFPPEQLVNIRRRAHLVLSGPDLLGDRPLHFSFVSAWGTGVVCLACSSAVHPRSAPPPWLAAASSPAPLSPPALGVASSSLGACSSLMTTGLLDTCFSSFWDFAPSVVQVHCHKHTSDSMPLLPCLQDKTHAR